MDSGMDAAATTQHVKHKWSALLSLLAAETRHDCVQGAQRAVDPNQGAWTHTRGGGGGPIWGQG